MSDPDHVLRVAKQRGYKSIDLYVVSGGSGSDGERRVSADLSWKAVGIHTYLVSRADGWEFNRRDLINRHSDGRHAVQSGLQELEEAGLLYRRKERSSGGEFIGWEWFVSERPLTEDQWTALVETGEAPTDGFSAVGFPDVGKSTPSNEEEEVYRRRSSSSGLRPSPGEPGEEDEGQDGFSREGWIQDVREADPDTFASTLFVEGLRGLLYGGTELPAAAPEGYDLSADLAKLRRRFDALGNEGVAELLLGLSALRESDELGGVDPGEGLTLGLVNRIDQQMGRSVWSWARDVGRREMAGDEDQGFLEELMEDEGLSGAA